MSAKILAALFALAVTAAAAHAASRAEEAVSTLVAAERGFAADAQHGSVQDAFVAHLDPEAWLFRPQPVRAKAWFDAHPGRPGTLQWEPEYAEIAASGDFGYTYGPWHATAPDAKGERQAWGHFFSVWKRSADGVWKNVVDQGYAHAEVPLKVTLAMRAPHTNPPRFPAGELDRRRAALLALDDALNGADGATTLQDLQAQGQVRHFREGALPSTDAAAAAPPVAAGLARQAVDIASSGDLAYTLGGRADRKADREGGYVRVWRFHGERWQLAVDLLTPPT